MGWKVEKASCHSPQPAVPTTPNQKTTRESGSPARPSARTLTYAHAAITPERSPMIAGHSFPPAKRGLQQDRDSGEAEHDGDDEPGRETLAQDDHRGDDEKYRRRVVERLRGGERSFEIA
jgi:hypothetical protein